MVASSRFSKDVDAFEKALSSEQRAIVRSLRTLILETGPDLEEKVKWRNPTYTRKGNVAWLILYQDHVDLGFFKGTSMKDPKKLLEGSGKGLRHVKIREKADIKPADFKALIQEAIALDG